MPVARSAQDRSPTAGAMRQAAVRLPPPEPSDRHRKGWPLNQYVTLGRPAAGQMARRAQRAADGERHTNAVFARDMRFCL